MSSRYHNLNIFRLLRIARDMSVKELSEKLLVTSSYINSIEKGDRIPSERLIQDYARICRVDIRIIENFAKNINGKSSFEHLLLSLLEKICESDKNKNSDSLDDKILQNM